MKQELIRILRKNSAPVSGEALSQRLDVSRVAVWKHIQKLIGLGYNIRSGPKGYRLIGEPDICYPWEFPGREHLVRYSPEIQSTMTEAGNLARAGCPQFTTVVTDRQTGGRGRLRRKWVSNPGGLYFTIVTRPELSLMESAKPVLAASLCVVRILKNLFDISAGVKWPNDVLTADGKICGILSEMEVESDMIRHINIGIGLNVNNDPLIEKPKATSIKRETGNSASRKRTFRAFLDEFEKYLGNGLDDVVSEWKTRTVTIGGWVRVETVNDAVEGLAVDMDDAGALIVRLDDGTVRTVFHGDCFHLDRETANAGKGS